MTCLKFYNSVRHLIVVVIWRSRVEVDLDLETNNEKRNNISLISFFAYYEDKYLLYVFMVIEVFTYVSLLDISRLKKVYLECDV